MISPSVAQRPGEPWPAGAKEAAIQGCRAGFMTRAEEDYLKRHNLTQLPYGLRNRLELVLEPFLATCNCVFDRLEIEGSVLDSTDARIRMRELASRECAPILPRKQTVGEAPMPEATK